MNYLGFSVPAMLHFIRRFYRHVKLESAEGDSWAMELETMRGEKVSFQGSLTVVVIDAFKPYVEHAKAERERLHKLIDRIGE